MHRKHTLFCILLILLFSLNPLTALDFAYNETLDTASNITLALTMVAPGTLGLIAPPSEYFAVGVSYAGTMGSAYLVRTILKSTISRERPYVGELLRPSDTSEDNQSFPSGHTLMAFSAAAYAQTMQSLFYPDSTTMKVVSTATWALALSTAVLRVTSGCHYISDVAAGAAIGSAIGFLGPFLTQKMQMRNNKAPQVLVGPTIGMQVSF